MENPQENSVLTETRPSEVAQSGIDFVNGLVDDTATSLTEEEARGRFTSEDVILTRRQRLVSEKAGQRLKEFLSKPPDDYDIDTYLDVFESAERLVNDKPRIRTYAALSSSFYNGINSFLDREDVDDNEVLTPTLDYVITRTGKDPTDMTDVKGSLYWKIIIGQALAQINSDAKTQRLDHQDLPGAIGRKVDFWKRIKKEVGNQSMGLDTPSALLSYSLSSGIVDKDPEILRQFAEMLDEGALDRRVRGRRDQFNKTFIDAGNAFKTILKEAQEQGWQNAAGIRESLDKIAKPDIPVHTQIITLANRVVDLLNRNHILENGMRLESLNNRRIEDTEEAVNRCLYVVFQYGGQPEGIPDENFLLTGQIVGKVFTQAARRLREVE